MSGKLGVSIESFIAASVVLFLCVIGFGVGVFFFGKVAKRNQCGAPPSQKKDGPCLSQKAGICPFEDETGALKNVKMTQISYNDTKS